MSYLFYFLLLSRLFFWWDLLFFLSGLFQKTQCFFLGQVFSQQPWLQYHSSSRLSRSLWLFVVLRLQSLNVGLVFWPQPKAQQPVIVWPGQVAVFILHLVFRLDKVQLIFWIEVAVAGKVRIVVVLRLPRYSAKDSDWWLVVQGCMEKVQLVDRLALATD